MWQPISTAPFDRDVVLAVFDNDEPHPVAFPCRQIPGGWLSTESKKWVPVRPTHWREWIEKL